MPINYGSSHEKTPKSSAGNTFGYVSGNPLMRSDPSGLFQKDDSVTCTNWSAAIQKARRLANCDNQCGSTENKCQTALRQHGIAPKCDICQYLNDSSPPKAVIISINEAGNTHVLCWPDPNHCHGVRDIEFNDLFCGNWS